MPKYLSTEADGVGYHYGHKPGDFRRIDARKEGSEWIAYVSGEKVGTASDLEMAELCALTWMDRNPDPDADDDEDHFDPENIYGLASIRQSIEEDRR